MRNNVYNLDEQINKNIYISILPHTGIKRMFNLSEERNDAFFIL